MKAVAFLGVVTREPSPETRAMLGLAEGFGLVVEEVMPDSPAAKAGVQRYDLLIQLDDQRLVNMDQLAVLVQHAGKGKEVVLTLKRAGNEERLPLVLGEKMVPVHRDDSHFSWSGSWSGNGIDPRLTEQIRENIERHMREVREQMERSRHGHDLRRDDDFRRDPQPEPRREPQRRPNEL